MKQYEYASSGELGITRFACDPLGGELLTKVKAQRLRRFGFFYAQFAWAELRLLGAEGLLASLVIP